MVLDPVVCVPVALFVHGVNASSGPVRDRITMLRFLPVAQRYCSWYGMTIIFIPFRVVTMGLSNSFSDRSSLSSLTLFQSSLSSRAGYDG